MNFDVTDIIEAVDFVYFHAFCDKTVRTEISSRVLRYAYEHHCDERTVYRQLQYARRIYMIVRSDLY